MKCPSCETENPVKRKFCRERGAKLVIICAGYGMENLPGDKFYGECGADLCAPKSAHPLDLSSPRSYTPKFLTDKILPSRTAMEGDRISFDNKSNFLLRTSLRGRIVGVQQGAPLANRSLGALHTSPTSVAESAMEPSEVRRS